MQLTHTRLSPAAAVPTERKRAHGDTVTFPVRQRKLQSYYAHDFGASVPQTCYSSSYTSPYRLYSDTEALNLTTSVFGFLLDVGDCIFSISEIDNSAMDCCSQPLDHLIIRIGEC